MIGDGGQHHAPAALPPVKTRYTLYRRLGGPQGPSGRLWKISPPPGFDPRTVDPVASRYTDWAIPAAVCMMLLYLISFRFKTLKQRYKLAEDLVCISEQSICYSQCDFCSVCICMLVLYDRGAQIFQKSVGHCKILGAGKMTEVPQMCILLHCTEFRSTDTLRQGFVRPCCTVLFWQGSLNCLAYSEFYDVVAIIHLLLALVILRFYHRLHLK